MDSTLTFHRIFSPCIHSILTQKYLSLALWCTISFHGTFQESLPDISDPGNFDLNTTDGSTLNIQITEYPVGQILLISPEELSPTISNTSSADPECLETSLNRTLQNLEKQVLEISSKLQALESKLEKRLIHDVKNSPNVFFIPPKSPGPGETDRPALEPFRSGKPSSDRVQWIIPLSESTTSSPEPPPRNLFSKDVPQTSTVLPQRQIDLLNRAKRKSDGNREGQTKSKVLSLCARIIPVEKGSGSSSLRRRKRTRRDVFGDGSDVTSRGRMTEWLGAEHGRQAGLREAQNEVINRWLASRMGRDEMKIQKLRGYHRVSSGDQG